ncbi:proton-coupled amino acid transporter-like protein CG1139 [Chelonus insularis]|uniref:proton-coupled amino acid transporter-like protein CG1139 n=1 Tax=Chelonus insularis TaxID=460826 RepID=UPI00158BDAAC|nr:proton-coupled amino acid transporter-like protein CG1139 [Chelonus insularis]XP_034950385.1 proton-coupled amino acid transporter-like protein CG1139 [Chelonus insularis]
MELHSNPMSQKNKGTKKRAETILEGTKINVDGDSYGVFRSNDPIISMDNLATTTSPHASDAHHMGADHPTSYCETMMHLFKGNVGSGIFALGDAFKNAGLLLGPPLTIFLGIICVHAQHILIECNEIASKYVGSSTKKDSVGYAGTVEMCFEIGPLRLRKYSVLMRKIVNLFICITQFGFCCVYFVFISTNMLKVLDQYGFQISVHWHMAIALLPILMSTWIRNLKYLAPVSSIANLLVVGGYVATIYLMCHDLPPMSERKYIAEWQSIPLFFGTVIYSFEAITLVLPLKNEMRKPGTFSSPLGVLNVGMIFVAGMFVAMGFLAYLRYGEKIEGSVTLNLNSKEILPQCIQIAISLSIMFTYALQFYVPIAIIWPEVVNRYGPFRYPVFVETCFRSVLCLLTFTLAEVIPNLGLFISLIGALSSTALALLFPPIIELVVCSQNDTLSGFKLTKDLFMLLIGFLGFLTGTYESMTAIIRAFSTKE